MHIKDKPYLKWLSTLVTPLKERDKLRYCYFYKDHGHNTIRY